MHRQLAAMLATLLLVTSCVGGCSAGEVRRSPAQVGPTVPAATNATSEPTVVLRTSGSVTAGLTTALAAGIDAIFPGREVTDKGTDPLGALPKTMPKADLARFTAVQRGWTAKYPVMAIHGFCTFGLVLEHGTACMRGHTGPIWPKTDLPKLLWSDVQCYWKHMELDPDTGTQPSNISMTVVRDIQSLETFFPGYHVWRDAFRALSAVGYNETNLVAIPYDWRKAPVMMEVEDHLFTEMKAKIEDLYTQFGEPVVFIAHSMGMNVELNFGKWVEHQQPGWYAIHIAGVINVAGPVLGVPKAVPALLSATLMATGEAGSLPRTLSEHLFGGRSRAAAVRSWSSTYVLWPAGNDAVWGDSSWAPDDTPSMREAGISHGPIVTVHDGPAAPVSWWKQLRQVIRHKLVPAPAPSWQPSHGAACEAYSADRLTTDVMEAGAIPGATHIEAAMTKWSPAARVPVCTPVDPSANMTPFNPVIDPLPYAPSAPIWCLYGIGLPTERSYVYRRDADGALLVDARMTDGDVTVPLLSLGAMCAPRGGWHTARLNPSNRTVMTVEVVHNPAPLLKHYRGGGGSSEHVDIVSNRVVIDAMLSIVTGHTEEVSTVLHSSIDDMAGKIDWSAQPDSQPAEGDQQRS